MGATSEHSLDSLDQRAMRRLRRAGAIPIWSIIALLTGGCLDDPPTFAPRGQIPPFILAGQVDPPLGAIYEGPSAFEINIPFRSEDVNIPIEARAYLDLVPGSSRPQAYERDLVPPGNFEELRFATINWTTPLMNCHSLTVIITYVDNYDVNGLPLDDGRAARVVWWTNMGANNDQTLMADCLGASQEDAVPGGP